MSFSRVLMLLLAAGAAAQEDSTPLPVPPLVPHVEDASDLATMESVDATQALAQDLSIENPGPTVFATWLARAASAQEAERINAWTEMDSRSPEEIPEIVQALLRGVPEEMPAAEAALDELCFARSDVTRKQTASLLLESLPGTSAEQPAAEVNLPAPDSGYFALMAALRQTAALRFSAQASETSVERVHVVQHEVLHRLATIASADQVPDLLEILLTQTEAAEGVLEVLYQIPGTEATQALVAALGKAPPTLQPRIAITLGKRGDPAAVDALKSFAGTTSGPAQWACLEALASLGEVLPAMSAEGASADFVKSSRYAGLNLRAAQVLADRGDKPAAEKVLVSFFDLHALGYQMRAALAALGQLGSPKAVSYALNYLGVPGVRETAIRVLTVAAAPGVDEKLVESYAKGDTILRCSVLEVLASRNAPAAAGLLEEALRAEAPELRFTAAQLAGTLPSEEDLGYLALKGDPALSQRALRVYLDLAHTRAISGDAAAAATQFRALVDGPFPIGARREALEGLGQLGLEADRALAQDYLMDPYLGEAAFAALAHIAAAQPDKTRAQEELNALARSAPSSNAQSAVVSALATLGADTVEFGLQQGYIAEWRVLGPFPNRQNEAFGKAFFEEAKSDAIQLVEYQGAQFEWRSAPAKGLPAIVDLQEVYGPYKEVAAYAAARLQVPRWTPVEVCVGVDEPFELWINGEKKHASRAEHPFQEEAERVAGLLKPGANRILLKVLQGAGDWKFCVRVVERRGEALDLSKQQLPDDGTTGVGVGAGTAINAAREALP